MAFDDIYMQLIGSVSTLLVTNFLGQRTVEKQSKGKESNPMNSYYVRAASVAVALVVFALLRWGIPVIVPDSLPKLQAVSVQPNSVKQGEQVNITVDLDRPAPQNGITAVLTSSDPALLTVDGNITVLEGRVAGTGYARAVYVPNYPRPVTITATYNGGRVSADVGVLKVATDPPGGSESPKPTKQSSVQVARREVASPAAVPAAVKATPLPAPAPLNPELVARLEEADGQLSAEKGFWDGVKQHMPGGSLRPEISSQLFAAESAAQRCNRAREASDAPSLNACIDSLNDHLNQLKIQH
jgi:hypothetical protein